MPTTLITDNKSYLDSKYPDNIFDQVIETNINPNFTYKKYQDGLFSRKSLEFKNTSRSSAYDLTPYDETLLLDTDFIISNSDLIECFEQPNNFLIYKSAFDLSGWRNMSEFTNISESGPEFYWATAVFFKKNPEIKIFFDLIKHIQENYSHYSSLYQLNTKVFRNDHAFSIAIHIMNGYKKGNFAKPMPGTMYFATDRDVLISIEDDNFILLLEKEKQSGQYFPCKITGSNVHVMNKFSLGRVIADA